MDQLLQTRMCIGQGEGSFEVRVRTDEEGLVRDPSWVVVVEEKTSAMPSKATIEEQWIDVEHAILQS